jgi:cell division septal protein FtsQ
MKQKIVDLRPTLTHSSRSPQRLQAAKNAESPQQKKKHAPLKTRRKRIRVVIAMVVSALVGAAVYSVHAISYHAAVRIQDISVRGTVAQDSVAIQTYVRGMLRSDARSFIAPDTILTYPKETIRAGMIRTFPRLKSVQIGRARMFSTELVIDVNEREPFGVWCDRGVPTIGGCFAFDESGLIFAEASQTTQPVLPYIFMGGVDRENAIGTVYIPLRMQEIRDLLQRLREARFAPRAFSVLDEKDFLINLENGFTIKATFGMPIDTVVHNLELVAVSPTLRGKEQDLEYIDLRFGNRVYYKFRGEEAISGESQ